MVVQSFGHQGPPAKILSTCRGEYYRKVRDALTRLQQAGGAYSAALLAGADISATVLSDLRQFLASDSAELPASLRQLARLAQSEVNPAVAYLHLPITCALLSQSGGLGSKLKHHLTVAARCVLASLVTFVALWLDLEWHNSA